MRAASPSVSRVVSALVAAWSVAVAPISLKAARRSTSVSMKRGVVIDAELGDRLAPTGRVERDDRIGAKRRPDARREASVIVERRARRIGRRQALDTEAVEQGQRCERCARKLSLDRVVRIQRELVDPEHTRERLAQPEPRRREREEVGVVDEELPDVPVFAARRLNSHALRVEHPDDVVVARDEEAAGRIESRAGTGEEPRVDVAVRADERKLGNLAVEIVPEPAALDVAVRCRVDRHGA